MDGRFCAPPPVEDGLSLIRQVFDLGQLAAQSRQKLGKRPGFADIDELRVIRVGQWLWQEPGVPWGGTGPGLSLADQVAPNMGASLRTGRESGAKGHSGIQFQFRAYSGLPLLSIRAGAHGPTGGTGGGRLCGNRLFFRDSCQKLG